ncbi:hypothetical protein DVH24_004445, partial [Malus domestica]
LLRRCSNPLSVLSQVRRHNQSRRDGQHAKKKIHMQMNLKMSHTHLFKKWLSTLDLIASPQIDEHMCRLRSSEDISTSSSSISHKLGGLQDLHDCVEKLLQLPLTQQALAQKQNKKCANELLDGSLRLLGNIKDALSQTKE